MKYLRCTPAPAGAKDTRVYYIEVCYHGRAPSCRLRNPKRPRVTPADLFYTTAALVWETKNETTSLHPSDGMGWDGVGLWVNSEERSTGGRERTKYRHLLAGQHWHMHKRFTHKHPRDLCTAVKYVAKRNQTLNCARGCTAGTPARNHTGDIYETALRRTDYLGGGWDGRFHV